MEKSMHLNPKYSELLKVPFGILIVEGNANKEALIDFIEKAEKIITVGDTTTEKFVKFGFIPDISVIDGKEKRKIKDIQIEYQVDSKIYCKNQPGELNEKIIDMIKDLISKKKFGKIQIIVDGEEDLIALPLLMHSPDKWVIFYGQPNEGLVVAEMNDGMRKKAKSIFNKVFF
jgi:uncharacterized protein (UPF0218 family)